jgi:hypothetical protein
MLNRLSKLTCLAHLSSLESIFIHCNIFWLSFALDIGFFIITFSTNFLTSVLFLHFIMFFVPNLGRKKIMLEIGPSSKSSWKNVSPLLTGCYSFFSSKGFDARTGYNCSSTTCCCNSSSSTSPNVETNFNYLSTSWGLIPLLLLNLK